MTRCCWDPDLGRHAPTDPETGERLEGGCENEATVRCAPFAEGPRFLLCDDCAAHPRFAGFVERIPVEEVGEA